jgi:hypothetical protein
VGALKRHHASPGVSCYAAASRTRVQAPSPPHGSGRFLNIWHMGPTC